MTCRHTAEVVLVWKNNICMPQHSGDSSTSTIILQFSSWFLRTAATRAAPLPEPSVDSIRSNLYSTPISWPILKDHVYRMVIVEGCCTMARSSSFRSKLYIGWHKSIVSSDWSDTMVWLVKYCCTSPITILYRWSLVLVDLVKGLICLSGSSGSQVLHKTVSPAIYSSFIKTQSSHLLTSPHISSHVLLTQKSRAKVSRLG